MDLEPGCKSKRGSVVGGAVIIEAGAIENGGDVKARAGLSLLGGAGERERDQSTDGDSQWQARVGDSQGVVHIYE